MPLLPGKSEVGHNIEEMEKAGHSHKQAVAAALHKAYDAKAAGILLRSPKGNALFLKRSDKARDHAGEWCCAGGSIEGIETPEQAAHRETREETGYSAGSLTQIDEGNGFVTFRADTGEEFEPKLNDEHTDFRWAPMDAPPEPLHPGVAATLKKLTRGGGALDKREYDSNDWYTVSDNPLSKVGVYPYSGRAIDPDGTLGLDPQKLYGVYRSAEELGNEETIKSFKLMPWTDDHPNALLGAAEEGLVPADAKGVHGVIGEDVHFDGDTLYGNIKVFSEALARKIAAGKRELSCGYRCDFLPQEGVFNGEPYQFVQRNLRGNHVASVDKGRMGSDVRVLDAAERFTFALDLREPEMSKRDDEMKDCLDADTLKFIGDSFNSLVAELEKKGYSKEYATKVAGKVAAEKGMTGHHDSQDSKVKIMSGTKVDDSTVKDAEEKTEKEETKDAKDGEVKDPEGKEYPSKKDDLKGGSKDKAKDKGMDAAEIVALVRKETLAGQKLYQRLSPVIGAFDHDEMTHREMAAYGLKKLGRPESTDPVTALDSYLDGYVAASSRSRSESRPAHALDSASDDSFVGRYINS
ncbi:MAG: DUF2213 domain-containing protein [Steroidobacteraceae bacterium]